MDVCESEQGLRKHRAVGSPRPPWSAAEKNNAVTTQRSRTKEVSSRYKSPSPATSSGSQRRCSSPNITRTTTASSQLLPKRAQSAGRKRPSTPSSPPSPSTPVHESSVDGQLSSRRIAGSRLQESLWPPTMRSLSVSFQSDTISKPVSKKEKAITYVSDRTLRPTSNVAHKQVETPTTVRKPTPERKRSPLKGKNVSDQTENSKPVDSLHSRLIDQHRWPSTVGGKVSSNASNRGVEFSDKAIRTLKTSVPETGRSSMRRLSLPNEVRSSMRRLSLPNEVSKPLQKSSSDTARLLTVDDSLLQVVRPHKFASASSSDKIGLVTPAVRSQYLSTSGSRPPSPIKTLVLSPFSSKGVSPSRSRPSSPPSRGVSPSRIRPINSSSQSNSSISVLSFIADFKRGKRGAAYIEDAHHLRLLYNRLLQWRFANARAEAVLYIRNETLEKTLYNVWNTTLSLRDSVIRKRINLQQLNLELKLNSVLNDQLMDYLNDWALLESDHVDALAGAVEDLKAGTLRLPVSGGAKADIEHLKAAICSAVDVMQAMGSAICSLLSRAEGMNNLVSELAAVAAQEKAMLDESEALLASAAAMQVEENSLRTHLMQMKQDFGTNKLPRLEFGNLNIYEPDLLLS